MALGVHHDGIPILRIADLAGPRLWDIATAGGCFHLEGGIEHIRLRAVLLDATRRFHAEPERQKMRLAINAARRGYVNYAAADASSLTAGQNRYAMFSIISRIRDVDEPSSYTRVFRGPNQWPDWLPGFEDCVMEGFRAFGELAACIMRSLASRDPTLQMATAHAFAEPLITLRLLRYEPLPERELAFPAHTDFGGITILLHERIEGLEIRSPDGQWRPLHARQGAFVCMFGEMTHRLTNGRVIAPPHRVVAAERERSHCAILFFDPGVDAVVAPAEALCAEELPRFEPLKYGAYLVRRSFIDQVMQPRRAPARS